MFYLSSVGVPTSLRLPAQSPTDTGSQFTFEVTAVRTNSSGEARSSGGFQPGVLYRVPNYTLRALIAAAYVRPQVSDFLIAGGPKWIDSDHFDVDAKAAGDFPPGPDGPARPPMSGRPPIAP